jgi:hypothetical protein
MNRRSPIASSFLLATLPLSAIAAGRGTAVANYDDNRQRLFFLAEPYSFHRGETIELKA